MLTSCIAGRVVMAYSVFWFSLASLLMPAALSGPVRLPPRITLLVSLLRAQQNSSMSTSAYPFSSWLSCHWQVHSQHCCSWL